MGLIYQFLATAFEVYFIALIIYILMSWLPGARESSFGEALAMICEPYLEFFRRIIPPIGMLDISPLAALFLLRLARIGLKELFMMIG
ncbi:MAG TPA: YggT family protein [Bacillota bacterium]|nr:YggT family protein [Bacillota bacterium]